MLAIRLPEEIEARLAELAARTGRTKTFYAKEAILKQFDEIEDKYLAIHRIENPGELTGLWRYRVRKYRMTGRMVPISHLRLCTKSVS